MNFSNTWTRLILIKASVCSDLFFLDVSLTCICRQFFINNYKQALELLHSQDALEKQMADKNINNYKVFREWLKEEQDYLQGLS